MSRKCFNADDALDSYMGPNPGGTVEVSYADNTAEDCRRYDEMAAEYDEEHRYDRRW